MSATRWLDTPPHRIVRRVGAELGIEKLPDPRKIPAECPTAQTQYAPNVVTTQQFTAKRGGVRNRDYRTRCRGDPSGSVTNRSREFATKSQLSRSAQYCDTMSAKYSVGAGIHAP